MKLRRHKKFILHKPVRDRNQIRNDIVVGRNEPCPCGSGKKFKNCCDNAILFKAKKVIAWLKEKDPRHNYDKFSTSDLSMEIVYQFLLNCKEWIEKPEKAPDWFSGEKRHIDTRIEYSHRLAMLGFMALAS